MKSGVEHGHVGQPGKGSLRGADAGEVGRIVQRCQRNAGFECGDNLIIDAHRVGIMLAAVHHAVADGADAALDAENAGFFQQFCCGTVMIGLLCQ